MILKNLAICLSSFCSSSWPLSSYPKGTLFYLFLLFFSFVQSLIQCLLWVLFSSFWAFLEKDLEIGVLNMFRLKSSLDSYRLCLLFLVAGLWLWFWRDLDELIDLLLFDTWQVCSCWFMHDWPSPLCMYSSIYDSIWFSFCSRSSYSLTLEFIYVIFLSIMSWFSSNSSSSSSKMPSWSLSSLLTSRRHFCKALSFSLYLDIFYLYDLFFSSSKDRFYSISSVRQFYFGSWFSIICLCDTLIYYWLAFIIWTFIMLISRLL